MFKKAGARGQSRTQPLDVNLGGRPTKFTPELRAKILAALDGGAPRSAAARLVGISEATLFSWLADARSDPEKAAFAAEVEQAEARHQTGLAATLTGIGRGTIKAKPGQLEAIKWALERRHANDWKERTETTHRWEEDVTVEELESRWANATNARAVAELPGGAD